MGSAYGAHANRYVDRMDGLRAVHGVSILLGFGVGNSVCRIVSRPFGMGAAAILQIRMPNGKPVEELGILNFEF